MQKNHSLPQLIYRITGILVLVMVVYTGYNTGLVPLSSFFILILLFSRIFPQFISLNSNINNIITTLPSVRMVMQLDDEFTDTMFQTNNILPGFPVEKEITLEGISFSYPGEEQLFHEFSEVIPAKRITGIVGVSGRGKTTLIDIIAGLQKPKKETSVLTAAFLTMKFCRPGKKASAIFRRTHFLLKAPCAKTWSGTAVLQLQMKEYWKCLHR
jgi:ABC-type multidrug transport system fused ATPase/permease subunit